MTRPASPFAVPPPKKVKAAKRDTASEAAEKAYVRQRDRWCVARFVNAKGTELLPSVEEAVGQPWLNSRLVAEELSKRCDGPLDVDHVRASGGLGLKSPTHRSNMVVLCRWHHRLKTEYGRVWRPLLTQYLARVEGDDAGGQ